MKGHQAHPLGLIAAHGVPVLCMPGTICICSGVGVVVVHCFFSARASQCAGAAAAALVAGGAVSRSHCDGDYSAGHRHGPVNPRWRQGELFATAPVDHKRTRAARETAKKYTSAQASTPRTSSSS